MPIQTHRLAYMAAVLIIVAGCSSRTKVTVPELDPDALPQVSCQVLLGGEKVKDAVVELRGQSKDSSKTSDASKILSRYDDEGECYSFFTMQGKDKKWGVPEGDYAVIVRPARGSKTRIPTKYADPKTSQLTAEIHAGTNSSLSFELTP